MRAADGYRLAVCVEFYARRTFRDYDHANWFERLEEKCFARSIITDAKYDVVKHDFSKFLVFCPAYRPKSAA